MLPQTRAEGSTRGLRQTRLHRVLLFRQRGRHHPSTGAPVRHAVRAVPAHRALHRRPPVRRAQHRGLREAQSGGHTHLCSRRCDHQCVANG